MIYVACAIAKDNLNIFDSTITHSQLVIDAVKSVHDLMTMSWVAQELECCKHREVLGCRKAKSARRNRGSESLARLFWKV